MQNEFMLENANFSNFSMLVDNFKCNPTVTKTTATFNFERVKLTFRNLKTLQKYIIFHLLFQYNLRILIILPDYLYSTKFFITKKNQKKFKVHTCKNLINMAYKFNNDCDKIEIVGEKSQKTKQSMIQGLNLKVIIMICIWGTCLLYFFFYLLIVVMCNNVKCHHA